MIALPPAGLTFPFPSAPPPGTLTTVAPGVHWLGMPLPFALDHVNLWLLADGDGWTAVDSGIADETTRALWRQVLDGPAAGRAVRRLVVTHFHPDHAGLAGWLAETTGAPVLMSRIEWLTGRLLSLTPDEAMGDVGAFFRSHGLPEALAATHSLRGNTYRPRVGPLPPVFTRLTEGDVLHIGGHAWRVMVAAGHAPEHVCLYSEALGVLIAGDQILPHITPNVSVQWFEPAADPLGEFLATTPRFRELPADTLVLPSHGRPFRGLHERIDALERHHAERLAEVVAAGARSGAVTAADLLPVLFRRPLDEHQMMFAMGEALAHLAHLAARGTLEAARDPSGVWQYRLAEAR